MTFSIVGIDKKKGEIGIAICSAIPCIGEYFAFGEAKCGIVAAQGAMNPYNGPIILNFLKEGMHPEEIIKKLKIIDKYIERRQISILSFNGDRASFTGNELTMGEVSHCVGDDYVAAGNTLCDQFTIPAMSEAFKSSSSLPLYERLLLSLEAGNATGGDNRGRQSAGLHVYAEEDYPIIKLNVDDDELPVERLRYITDRYMTSFYHLMPFFSKRSGEHGTPQTGSKADLIFKEFRKKVGVRNFNIK